MFLYVWFGTSINKENQLLIGFAYKTAEEESLRFKKALFFCSWFRIDKKMTKKSTRYFWSLFIPINDIVILT